MGERNWRVWKFGGTSVGDASRIESVVDAVISEVYNHRDKYRLAVVVSAMSGVTNWLADACDSCADVERVVALFSLIYEHHVGTARQLLEEGYLTGDLYMTLVKLIDRDMKDNLMNVILSMATQKQPSLSREDVLGRGELWSSTIVDACLETKLPEGLIKGSRMDSREVFQIREDRPTVGVYERVTLEANVSADNLKIYLEHNPDASVFVAAGYICRDSQMRNRTFMRNGGDYSASLLSELLKSVQLTIWTDVDGLYTADPRLIREAVRLPYLSYSEAVELAYFGAKALHPFTMEPCLKLKIPILLRSSFNPSSPGTLISHCPCLYFRPPIDFVCSNNVCATYKIQGQFAKAFSLVNNVALVTLHGTCMVGVPGIAARMFSALRDAHVSCILITQGSSEHSICVGVTMEHVDKARRSIEDAFHPEIYGKSMMMSTTVKTNCTIVSAIGDHMCGRHGVLATLAHALASVNVNVSAVCQGASEKAINFVTSSAEATAALRALHDSSYPLNSPDDEVTRPVLIPPPTSDDDATAQVDVGDLPMNDALPAAYSIVLLGSLPLEDAMMEKVNAANEDNHGLFRFRRRATKCKIIGVTDGVIWCPLPGADPIVDCPVGDLLKLPEAQNAILVDVRIQQSDSPTAFLNSGSRRQQQALIMAWRKLDRIVVESDSTVQVPCAIRPSWFGDTAPF